MKPRKNKLRVWLHTYCNGKPVWHWHLQSTWNGQIICAGEPNGYSSKDKAMKGWKAVEKSVLAGVEVVE